MFIILNNYCRLNRLIKWHAKLLLRIVFGNSLNHLFKCVPLILFCSLNFNLVHKELWFVEIYMFYDKMTN